MIGEPFYHGTVKKSLIVFGALFNDIQIQRRADDSVSGDVKKTIIVPVQMGHRDKNLIRQEQNPNIDAQQQIQEIMPRIVFEVNTLTIDTQRVTNPIEQIVNGEKYSFNAIPVNLDIQMTIISNYFEDLMQIVEQIIPFFNPSYGVTIKGVEGIDKDIAIEVNMSPAFSLTDDSSSGDFLTRRRMTFTNTFILKTITFPRVRTAKLIKKVITNISEIDAVNNPFLQYVAEGDIDTRKITKDEWSNV